MTTYLVRLNGQNFLMDGDGGPRKKRFQATLKKGVKSTLDP